MDAFLSPVCLPQMGISRDLQQSDQEASWERNGVVQDMDEIQSGRNCSKSAPLKGKAHFGHPQILVRSYLYY
jgi:hypothetical protein